MAEVYRDPGLLDLLSKKSDLADKLIQQYGALDNARNLNPDCHRDYQVLYEKHKDELGHLSWKKYDAEYKAYWKTQQPESTELPEHQTPAAGQSELDIILNAQDREGARTSINVEQLVKEEALATAAMLELAASLDEEEADNELDAVQSRQADELPTTKSHGWFGKRDIARHAAR
ncbi:hypothetical protein SLS64_011915 [Diaporthe eres]|uniref:Uncharacterized protein n=1 Tax=Diaporthe eres TaxID=83184 RepID=A0ABR1NPF3_DIAER